MTEREDKNVPFQTQPTSRPSDSSGGPAVGPHATPVLIVDDDPDLCEALSDSLEHEGYRVHAVGRGAEAIQQARRIPYAAVLLDLRLPDLDGQAVLKALTELDPTLPVIILTGFPTTENTVRSLVKGAFACLTKPYNPDVVKATLRRAVAVKRLAVKAERVEHALSESEERFRSLVESATDAIVVADEQGHIVSWNNAARALFAYSADEVIGKPLTMLMPARYREAHQRGLERVSAGGASRVIGKTVELRGLRRDGAEFPLELSLAMWKTRGGTFYSGIIRDISERKQAEEALRESEDRFRQLAENIREVFWMTDPQKDRILYVSPAYEEIWGRATESLYESPRSWLDAIHPSDRARVLDAALTKQVSGNYDEEYRVVRPDGAIRWIHDRAFPIHNESGTVYRIAGIAEDITERKQAQAALRDAYQKTKSILSSLPGAILIVNDKQEVVYVNSLAEHYFGAPPPSLVGRPLFDILSLSESPRFTLSANLRNPMFDDATHLPEGEFEIHKRVYWYRLFPVTLGTNGRRQTGLVIQDITEQRLLQDQLIQAEKLASLGTLVSGMAHEINNPVQGILGMAELILQEHDPVIVREYAQDIVRCAQHTGTVVRDFVSYARPAASGGEDEIRLSERLAEALKMIRLGPDFGHVEVMTEFEPVPPLCVRRGEIDQVFLNLISNAVQAMRGSGRLTLATRWIEGTIAVQISDTGGGIPKNHLTRIFDPFFTTKAPGKGTGLGLSIVYKIVTKYRGTITVDSEEGKGTTFTIRFPTGEHHKEARDATAQTTGRERQDGTGAAGG